MEKMQLSNWRDILSNQVDELKVKSDMVIKGPKATPFRKPNPYIHKELNDPKSRDTVLSSSKVDTNERKLPVLPDTDNTSTVLNKCSKLLSDIARYAVEKVFLEKCQHNPGHQFYALERNVFVRSKTFYRKVEDILKGKRKNDLELHTMALSILADEMKFIPKWRFLEFLKENDRSFTANLWKIDYYNSWFLCVNKEAIAKEELYYMWQVITEAVVCIGGEDFTTKIETLAKSETCEPVEIPDKHCTRTSENSNNSKSTVSQKNVELYSTTAHLHFDERNLDYAIEHGRTGVVETLLKAGAKINTTYVDRETPLHVASKHGNTDIVKLLLQHGAEVNIWNDERESPLYVASKHGHTDVVKLLLQHKARVNNRYFEKEPPLFVASKHGHTDVVKLLLQHEAEVNNRYCELESLLFVASKHGNNDVVKLLLQHEAKVNICNKEGESPLYVASKHGYTDVVKLLLQHGAKVNIWNDKGEPPLYVASKHGHTDVVKLLLQHGAKVNIWNDKGEPPLYVASKHGHTDVVKLLLQHDAEVNIWNDERESPLYVASKHGHTDVVELLLQHEAEVNIWDDERESPLFVASKHGHTDVVKLLLQHEAEVNIWDDERESPLFVASKHGHTDVVKLLLQHKARVNNRYFEKEPPLFVASKHGHTDVVKLLLQHDAEVNIWDDERESPLDVASKHGHTDVVKLLLQHGAEVNIWNDERESPLDVASKHGHTDVVKLLLQHGAEVNIWDDERESPLDVASKHGHTDVVKLLLQHGARTKPLYFSSERRHVNMSEYFSQHRDRVNFLGRTILDDRLQEIFEKIEVSVSVPKRQYALPNGKIYHIYFIHSTSADEEKWVQSTIKILTKHGYTCFGTCSDAIDEHYFEKIEKESSTICLVLSRCFMNSKNACLSLLLSRPFQGLAIKIDDYRDTDLNFSDLTIIDVPYSCDSGEDKIEWFKELLKQLQNKDIEYINEIANKMFNCNPSTAFRVKRAVGYAEPIDVLILTDTLEKTILATILENRVMITNPKIVNKEASVIYGKSQDRQLTKDEMFTAKNIIQSNFNQLFQNHRNLNIITTSVVRSKQGGKEIINEPCIVLYCYCKGLIPDQETDFPKILKCGTNQLPVDVREGFFELGGRYHTYASTIYHEKIKIGCGFGIQNQKLEGSVGPFLKCFGGVGFLTCAHTTCDVHHENYHYCHPDLNVPYNYHFGKRFLIEQPSSSVFNSNGRSVNKQVGEVYEAIFKPNCSRIDESSVDVGVVKITNQERIPQRGEFAVISESNLNSAGFTELPIFEGSVMTDPQNIDARIVKFGMTSHATRGVLTSTGTVVRSNIAGLRTSKLNSYVNTFQNQYEVGSITTLPPFFLGGDSGSGVFQVETTTGQDILHLIGLAIGFTSYHATIVTPIKAVMDALNINETAFKLKDDSDAGVTTLYTKSSEN